MDGGSVRVLIDDLSVAMLARKLAIPPIGGGNFIRIKFDQSCEKSFQMSSIQQLHRSSSTDSRGEWKYLE